MSNISPAKHHTTVNILHSKQRNTLWTERFYTREEVATPAAVAVQSSRRLQLTAKCSGLGSFPLQYYGQVTELDTGLLPLLYTPFRHVYHSTNDSISRYLCVLDMQITQSAQSLCRYWVYMSAAPCRRVCTAAARPAWFGDYKYKYHLTTNTVGTTGTCGHGV